MRFYRAKDFQAPAIGVVIRWVLIGIQIGRRNYIAAHRPYPTTHAAVVARKRDPR